MDSTSTARFCVFENAVMDFTKMIDVARPGRETGSRKWEKGFLGTHCDKKYGEINYFDVRIIWYLKMTTIVAMDYYF